MLITGIFKAINHRAWLIEMRLPNNGTILYPVILLVCHAQYIVMRKMEDDDFMLVDDWKTCLDDCADRELNRLRNIHSKVI